MEKKTTFNIQFIHSHLKKLRLIRASKSSQKRPKTPEKTEEISIRLPLIKYFSPLTVLRTIGDFAYLDQISNYDEYVPFSALNLHFKQIREVKTSANFTICCFEDNRQPFIKIDHLIDRLMSLNDKDCYDLACCLKINEEKHRLVNITGKTETSGFNEEAFFKILDENAQNPMILYHYKYDEELGFLIHKIGVNRILKDMTMMNDMQIFEEGPLVIPCQEYFQYMNIHMSKMFGKKNEGYALYLQTPEGILKVYANIYQVFLANENILMIIIKKKLQEPNVQLIFEGLVAKERREKEENKGKNKKNMKDWEEIVKKYYAPFIFKEKNQRCGFRYESDDQLL